MNLIGSTDEMYENAMRDAKVSDSLSMKRLFDAVATKNYVEATEKTFEELENFDARGWSDGLCGTEWESVEDCIMCAEEAASQLLEEEAQNQGDEEE